MWGTTAKLGERVGTAEPCRTAWEARAKGCGPGEGDERYRCGLIPETDDGLGQRPQGKTERTFFDTPLTVVRRPNLIPQDHAKSMS